MTATLMAKWHHLTAEQRGLINRTCEAQLALPYKVLRDQRLEELEAVAEEWGDGDTVDAKSAAFYIAELCEEVRRLRGPLG